MTMHENKYINFMLRLLFVAVIGVLGYLGFKYVLKYLVPLIIAYLISCIIVRPINWLGDKGISRKLMAIVFTLLAVTLVGLLVYALVSTLIYEGTQLAAALPNILSSLSQKLDNIQVSFDDLFSHLPLHLRELPLLTPSAWLSNIKLPDINVGGALSSAAGVASSVPGFILSLVFVFVATYFLASEREDITAFVRRQLSPSALELFAELREYFFSSVFKWIKAQCILICITFCILCVWFFILRQPFALVLAVLIAIIDALPILGVGTVMIPWALFDLLSGDFRMAIFHILMYVSVLIVRNTIEPKIVGVQLGIHPFVSLLAVYFGFRLGGFAGMFLLPMAVLCVIKLQETGRIRLWKSTESPPKPREEPPV